MEKILAPGVYPGIIGRSHVGLRIAPCLSVRGNPETVCNVCKQVFFTDATTRVTHLRCIILMYTNREELVWMPWVGNHSRNGSTTSSSVPGGKSWVGWESLSTKYTKEKRSGKLRSPSLKRRRTAISPVTTVWMI